MELKILVINPGSTSTKVAYYENEKLIKINNIKHTIDILYKFDNIYRQLEYRLKLILNWLIEENINQSDLTHVVARGGMLRSIPSGVYEVTDLMVQDLYNGIGGIHASNLGGILARRIADENNIKAYIVDPVSVDEFTEIARISGLKNIERKSRLHALNIKAVTHKYSKDNNRSIEDLNLIVAHLGGGISICAIEKGRMIDTNNANEMGPYSPERTGTLPVGSLIDLCYSKKYSYDEMKSMINGKGGLISYLGLNDGKKIENKIEYDEYTKLIYDGMIYQINKEIGTMATVLKGKVDGIILTGGLSYSSYITKKIKEAVSFISNIYIYPGENEMEALNKGIIRVFIEGERLKIYDEVIVDEKL